MGKLFLLCGKPGSGKTTLANSLKEKFGIIHFSADDFMLKLFGEIEDRHLFDKKLKVTKDLIYQICDDVLRSNNVVLDFGFWTKSEREQVINRFKNYEVIIIYLKLDEDKIFNQIEKRNANLKDSEYFMDLNTFNILSSKFEEPTNEEYVICNNTKEFVEEFKQFLK